MKGQKFVDDEHMLSTLQVADWRTKIKNSSTMESKLRKNVGPNAFQF